jgi:hypothetical protein
VSEWGAVATNIKLIFFGLARSGLEPTTYITPSEHSNHYRPDVEEFEDAKSVNVSMR